MKPTQTADAAATLTSARGARRSQRSVRIVIAALAAASWVGNALAQGAPSGCGALQNAYGPYDYRTNRGYNLKIVEDNHFTPQVEALVKGVSGSLGGDLDYTLRAFPNHHRALISMMRLGEKVSTPIPPQANYSVECYFDRAMRFRDDDTTVRIIYSMYLYSKARAPEAVQQLDRATALAADSPFTHFNIGLVFLDNKNFDRALLQAHRAAELGFTRTELKERLTAAGKWREPAAVTAASSPAASAAAAVPAEGATASPALPASAATTEPK